MNCLRVWRTRLSLLAGMMVSLGIATVTAAELRWLDVRDLGVEGRGWTNTESFFDRLPASA
jgi:hypothetical protein